MKKIPLKMEEQAGKFGANLMIELTHADLTETVADTDQTIALLSLAANEGVECIGAELVTPFADASDGDFNSTKISIGDGSDADRLLTATELNANGTEVDRKFGTGTRHYYLSADTVDAEVESMAAKSLSDLDAGCIHIYFRVVRLTEKEAVPADD